MSGKHRLNKAISQINLQKADRFPYIPGILGITMDGSQLVEVPNREGYVYVRLRDNQSELLQAYNAVVAPVYGLPVLLVRDDIDPTRYRVIERDLGRYSNWGSSYLPLHGNQHSFSGDAGGGGDPVWVYARQFMPLLPHPSGTKGSAGIVIEPYTYYWDQAWRYGGGTGTASFLPYKPTGDSARMVLVYLDDNTNPALSPGSEYFSAAFTGSTEILPYVPELPLGDGIPICAVRLVSGTSKIGWSNIYDLRPFIVGDGFIATGSAGGGGHIIQDEGVDRTARTYLNFAGNNVWATDDAGNDATKVGISGAALLPHLAYPVPLENNTTFSDPPTDYELNQIWPAWTEYPAYEGFVGIIDNGGYGFASGGWLVAVSYGFWGYVKLTLAE